MSKRYTAGVVSSTSPTVNAAGASGVFTLEQQTNAQSNNNWPPYKVEKSLRFRSAASGYLTRTPSATGNRKIWTWSAWIKRAAIGSGAGAPLLFMGGTGLTDTTGLGIAFGTEDKLYVQGYNTNFLATTQVFRDVSAWYHIMVVMDSTNATANNRLRVYVNGSEVTAFSTRNNLTQNTDYGINQASLHTVGYQAAAFGYSYFDGYMSEINFVDGQALTPASFGATNKDGNWSPIAYTGSYGTNGFYLNFKDITSAATTGYDYSGNGNNWTLSGFNVSTANTTYASMIDVPEDQSDGTANNRGNYCVLNPVARSTSSNAPVPSNGNLQYATAPPAVTSWPGVKGSIGASSGKFYFECDVSSLDVNSVGMLGWADEDTPTDNDTSNYLSKMYGLYFRNDSAGFGLGKMIAGTGTSFTGGTDATNGTYQVAIDFDAGKIWLGKTNTWYDSGNPSSGTNQSGTFTVNKKLIPFFTLQSGGTGAGFTLAVNFGQRPFTYAPPSGFKALNTFNLPDPTIKQPNQYFDALLYTGNGSSSQRTDISWTNMQPDMVWIKNRTTANNHVVHDVIRGPAFALQTNLTNATDGPVGFGSDGFGSDTGVANQLRVFTNDGRYNLNNNSYVAWGWKGTSSNTTNTSGSITSIVRANQTAGFSIVTWTSQISTPYTVGHGLGVAPSLIIVKFRSIISNWNVYHQSLGATKYLTLNTTDAATTSASRWNDTAPTSNVFTLGSSSSSTATMVAYCFAEVAGYSAFGSYTGNGSTDGPFVYTGFRPRWIMIKRTDSATGGNWNIQDTSRTPFNWTCNALLAELSNAEITTELEATYGRDYLSNGFKIRASHASHNASGSTYIYAAFAEMPFKYARAR